MKCDLSDWEETARTASNIAKQTDRIDILINNAARGIMSYQLAKNGIDLHMATNHFGHVVLTSHLLPTLKETAKNGMNSYHLGKERRRQGNQDSNSDH